MKLYTSYFYQVRFFKPYQIPLSTAIWDPRWYHNFKRQNHYFIDKNGVINGLRCEQLKPGETCHNLCKGKPCQYNLESCKFLEEYRKQIFSIDRDSYIKNLEVVGQIVKEKLNFIEEPEIILLVHEAPDNECSERKVLQEFFNCKEWSK